MKRNILAVTMLAGVLAFGFVFAGCDNSGGDQTNDEGDYGKTSVSLTMISVPGGSFRMGMEEGMTGTGDLTTVHTVTLTGFYISKHEVTEGQYKSVMGALPSWYSVEFFSGKGDNYPIFASWYEAIVFCNKLSMKEGKSPAYRISGSTNPSDWGTVLTNNNSSTWDAVEIVSDSNGYRLPTEAQWEYAARGGDNSPGNYTYAGSNDIDKVAWYSDNSGWSSGNSDIYAHEVGKKTPNGLGLYDMSGNVWEWCWDWYSSSYYSSSPENDPEGPVSGSRRVLRGGCWNNDAGFIRSGYRYSSSPYNSYATFGFRLVHP